MTNTDKIKVKPYRNWVRGALGLFYLQKGLYPFTDSAVKAEHSKIVQKLLPCTGCAIENILPAHAKGKVCIQKNKAKCNCRKGTNRSCATCSKIYDDIVLLHRFREPHWVTDCSTWYTDHWQFAKCFLTTTSKGSSNTAAETDASGLLSIIINGEFFQSNIQCNIDPPNDIFSQVRDIRNAILHNSEQDLTDQEVTRYLQSMIAVLEDKKALSINPPAEAAAKTLKKILKDELIITMSEEAKVIQTALEAIKAVKEQSEESIRKLAEETYYSLRQQTSEFNTEIDGAKERAMEKVASTVSTVFGEIYEPEIRRLKLGHEDHENRLKVIEAEQKELQRKQLELEQHVAKLKLAEEKYQTRIEYLKQKQALQQHLVDEYQKHYVKTWISPLNTKENDVNISDVYVSPKMVVDKNKDGNNENNTEKNGNNRGRNKNHIERYCDLFGTDEKRNRKIFIVGDVGTGKSSFCKMMMHNWCTSITKRGNSDDSGVIDEEGMTHEKENDMYDMNQFDFLFYIPLGEMPEGIVDTVDMIKTRSEIYRTLIDDIFTNLSDRILILADGLDEWAQPKSNRQSPHHGVPTSHFARNSTIITTSRPSSRGILNMKSSDYDLVITLVGLKNSSVAPMVEKYMKLLNETPTPSVRDFDLKTLSNLNVKDIQNAPMLLQQIIWLHCKGHNVGKSRSSVYSDIVNTVLAWELDKLSAAPVLHDFKNSSFEQLPLPKYFDSLERCQYNRNLLLLIGYIAYDAYIKSADSVSLLVFGRYKLNKLGVSDDAISAILRTGILTEVNCTDPTQAKSQLSFIHTSYVEFFAALYICSRYLLKVSDAYSSGTALTLLEGLIAVTPETSVAEILRLENVLIMICGLITDLTEHVCECIYNVTLRDKSMDEDMFFRKVIRVQSLTFDCLLEHNSVDQHTVKSKLRHFYYGPHRQDSAITCFTDLDPTSIESCRMHYPVPLPCSYYHHSCHKQYHCGLLK
ncbi:uncharacterized protein LOC128546662 [Mercenaria mercenaria]|uniref:uncharacterized protein LOC128546662 n=1 Tax=Mercenaria mercenaria TaxID=6596 RepID=UPI00234F83FF|nr:uncharacterized protein LOC128546662 [Mercenaria mercenaria]XP_053373691.1 uncharacterized protein LOC128546662 [Mercenaria mercenaria]